MAVMGQIRGGSGGTESAFKDYVKAMASKGSFSFADAGYNRGTVNESYLNVDTTNKYVYLYCDFTMTASLSANADILYSGSGVPSCMPSGSSGTISNYIATEKNGTASSGSTMKFSYYTSGTKIGILSNSSVSSGDRYVVYMAWQYA